MTPDASPPADVQRPEPLTEEEREHWLEHWEATAMAHGYLMAEDALPLIADLRASRAEVERLRAVMKTCWHCEEEADG